MKMASDSIDTDVPSVDGIDNGTPRARSQQGTSAGPGSRQWLQYVAIARPHHYGKNVLVIVGAILAFQFYPEPVTTQSLLLLLRGLCATCLIASSNYVLNEILDAHCDRHHSAKRNRPLAAGHISPRLALVEWCVLGAIGQWIAATINQTFSVLAITFQLMAIAYNARPVRLKDIPYLDVLSEAINSPLRFLLGWALVIPLQFPDAEIILAFWTAGAWEMARKRRNELQFLQNPTIAACYRKSFTHYNENRLLASMVLYGVMTVALCLLYGRRLILHADH